MELKQIIDNLNDIINYLCKYSKEHNPSSKFDLKIIELDKIYVELKKLGGDGK